MSAVSADRILRYAAGAWQCGLVTAAVQLRIFELLAAGLDNAAAIAQHLKIEVRAAQALLDGLLALELVERTDGAYRNSADASHFLVPGRADYLGGFVELGAASMPKWLELGRVALTGEPLLADFDPKDHPDWETVVLGITPLALAAARAAADRLDIEEVGAFDMLDVGGGAGPFTSVWLALNEQGRSTQVDWSNVNRVARDYTARFGVADRFTTIDGDLHEVDFGEDLYDYAVLSQIVHFFSAEENVRLIARLRRAIKPGGALVIADFVLDDQRGGHPWALMFGANMLLSTREGACYPRAEFERWFAKTGFDEMAVEPIDGMPHSLVYAR